MVKWICEGRLWWDKVNGNTYHSYQITDTKTNKVLFEQGMAYGGQGQWKHEVAKTLVKLGLLAEEDKFNYEKIGDWFFWTESTGLKRDMFKGLKV